MNRKNLTEMYTPRHNGHKIPFKKEKNTNQTSQSNTDTTTLHHMNCTCNELRIVLLEKIAINTYNSPIVKCVSIFCSIKNTETHFCGAAMMTNYDRLISFRYSLAAQ